MTCETVREFIDKHPLSVTRGERAAVIGHIMNCLICATWLEDSFGDTPMTPEVAEMCDGDYTDPEFHKVVFGDESQRATS